MAVSYHTHTFEIPVASKAEVAAGAIGNKVAVPSSLGSAAASDTSDFASATQGTKADGAAQKDQNLADLANAVTARTNLGLGTAAVADAADFGTSAQGALADTSLQPATGLFKVAAFADASTATIPATVDLLRIDDTQSHFVEVDSEPAHDLKFQNGSRWFEVVDPIPTEKSARAVADNVTDDSAAIQRLVDWAMVNPQVRKIALNKPVYCASDIENIHDVQWTGTGSIRIGTGSAFFVDPNSYNRGFGGLGYNDIYIGQDGSDTASGLSTEYPTTVLRAREIMAKRGNLSGIWRLVFLEGVYTDPLVTWDSESASTGFYLLGPAVDAWDSSSPPPEAVAITAVGAASPAYITAPSHGLSDGDKIFVGMAKYASGEHPVSGKIYTIQVIDANGIRLPGIDGSAWPAYTTGGKVYPLKGSRPRAIFYGSGDSGQEGLRFQNFDSGQVNDLMFINWGTKSGTGQDSGITITGHCNVRMYNVHTRDCARGGLFRDRSIVVWESGEGADCGKMGQVIDAHVTMGKANVTGTDNGALLCKRNNWDIDCWEMSNGHFDGNRCIDSGINVQVRKNGHMVALSNTITNTSGTARQSMIVDDAGHLAATEDQNTWVGSFRPRILRRGNGIVARDPVRLDWLTPVCQPMLAIAAGAGEVTVISLPIPQTVMSALGHGLSVYINTPLNPMAGTLTLRFKKGSTTIFSPPAIPLSANGRQFRLKYDLFANGFDTARGFYEHRIMDNNTLAVTGYDSESAGGTFNTMSASDTFSVTAQFSNAADTLSAFGWVRIDTIGW